MLDLLKLEALHLGVGESTRIECPVCRARDEKSMKITRTESGVSATCFRGKCGYRTYTGGRPTGKPETSDNYPTVRVFDRPTRLLSPDKIARLQARYGLTEQEIRDNRFMAECESPRLVMPIFDPEGEGVGYVSKRMGGHSQRKSLTYWHKQVPPMHYPRCPHYKGAVFLVEDTLSSIRVARHVRCRALLGTHLMASAISQLQQETDKIVLALDNDMIPRMVNMVKQLRGMFDTRVLVWDADPKDMQDDRVKEQVYEYN